MKALFILLPMLAAIHGHAEPLKRPDMTVNVDGMRGPAWKSYASFLRGIDTFDRLRHRAPTARLQFFLQSTAPLHGITMDILVGDESVTVPVAVNGAFNLPVVRAAAEMNADILLNRKRETVSWHAMVRSAGLQPNQVRLGDLRVACEVRAAVDILVGSPLAKMLAEASKTPMCQTPEVFERQEFSRAVRSATLRDGERELELKVRDRRIVHIPIGDDIWSDDAVVNVELAP
jgi:hypothetical protein